MKTRSLDEGMSKGDFRNEGRHRWELYEKPQVRLEQVGVQRLVSGSPTHVSKSRSMDEPEDEIGTFRGEGLWG